MRPSRSDSLIRTPVWILALVFLPGPALADQVASSTASRKTRSYVIDEETTYVFEKPGPFDFAGAVPKDIQTYVRDSFRRENYLKLGGMMALTAVLVYYDQTITDETQKFGRRIHISNEDRTTEFFRVAGLPIRLPTDTGSALYFLGDGWTQVGVTAAFFGTGLVRDDPRALRTASQMAEGIVTVGILTQFLKHVTGRESPYVSTSRGGRWVPFPDQIEYHKHVARYDAYPSGHVATAMVAFTIMSENYPEQRWIKPLSWLWISGLSFQMVNNGVHWISDYPLSLAIGYSIGKLAVSRGRKVVKSQRAGGSGRRESPGTCGWEPAADAGMGLGLRFRCAF